VRFIGDDVSKMKGFQIYESVSICQFQFNQVASLVVVEHHQFQAIGLRIFFFHLLGSGSSTSNVRVEYLICVYGILESK
jgi:hypothetical protein